MAIIYHLSGNQRKALLVSGQCLRLALPAPVETPTALVEWARSVLPGEFRAMVRSAEECEIEIAPKLPSFPRDTITGILGDVVHAQSSPIWTVVMAVVIADLVYRDPPRSRTKIQWPANVLLAGRPFAE